MKTRFEKTLLKLNTPFKIQECVSKFPYNPDDYCRSVEHVFRDQKAHCLEGALFAAVALERLGHEPQLLHLRSHRDDDHVVAMFRHKGLWGAVGKSNTTLLAWRHPFYKSPRELVMSYFPFYFNLKGQMSLVSWAGPIKLSKYEKWNWRNGEGDISDMGCSFYDEKANKLISMNAIEKLTKAPEMARKACFLGANMKGLFKC